MANSQLEQAGAQPQKQPRYVPLFIDHMFTGYYSQRAALHDPSDIATARFYGGRLDSIWSGKNVELTNRFTLQRRPGLSAFSTVTYPTPPDRAFSFQLTDGIIQVLIDTTSTGSLPISAAANASTGTTVYTGVFPLGGSNAYVGMKFTIAGFTNGPNNGTFVATASTTTTLTLTNPDGIAESIAAMAVSSGAIYIDNQDGTKTLLYGKGDGAGQAYFVAVAGILYIGDGVDVVKYTPGNPNGTIWNWGTLAPTAPPGLVVTETGAAAVAWMASTWFSTMGIIVDSNGVAELLIGVNNAGNQTGMSGNGQPDWVNTAGSTTSDNSVIWTCYGQIVNWAPAKGFSSFGHPGASGFPNFCYDSITGCIFFADMAATSGTTGATRPNFQAIQGAQTNGDGTVNWRCIGSPSQTLADAMWLPSHAYSVSSLILEPFVPPTGPGQPLSTTPMFAQFVTTAGTSGTYSSPFGSSALAAGQQTVDNQLLWISLGSASWSAGRNCTAWTNSTDFDFTAIVDGNGNLQVCTVSGVSASSPPTFTQNYGSSVTESTGVQWTCCGSAKAATWVAGQNYYLPKNGFAPPTASDPYGGASVLDTNDDVEFTVNTGVSGTIQPIWNGIGQYTPDPNGQFALTQVAVGGGNATYTGTITGGDSNAFVGDVFLISGFLNGGNNVLITVTASTATTLVAVATTQVDETHAALATQGDLIWYNLEANPAFSLSWTKGHNWAYSYKARSLTDFYSTPVNGILPIPPGLTNPLPAPTGSETGLISTASPAAVVTGSNAGAIVSVYGQYSPDPQIDTIVIWRDADGGGPDNMFELTEIPNIPANAGIGTYIVNGIHYDWVFQDYLPDTPTSQFPGLNNLIPAPIDDSNDPPPSAFLPMVYNFQRIWGAVGSSVFFSGGPDVITGNPNEAFNPADVEEFLAPVTRLVKNSQGIVSFLTDSIQMIAGGPATSSFFTFELAPSLGLLSYNFLDVYAGEIFFFSSDNQAFVLSPSLNLSPFGYPVADQFANMPSSGVSDATWNPATGYLAVHQKGIDNAIFFADGSTGWYRVNPHQANAGVSGAEPVWSLFAAITNGCKMVQSVETAPGIKQLLVGSTTGGNQILKRDLSVFTDNGTTYPASFVMGSITLAHPGQIAVLKFLEMDFSGINYKPTVSYLLNEIAGTFTPFHQSVFDPPQIYGTTIVPTSYSPNRYYFSQNASLARCRHLQIQVSFNETSNGDEIYDLCIFGKIMIQF